MTLDEIRVGIDEVDSAIKPLFLKRMNCARGVAEAKKETGGDVFVLERELAIIEKRAGDVPAEVYDEYVMFLRTLMSISRRYQYGILTGMQDLVLSEAMKRASLDERTPHSRVSISFSCDASDSDLNLFINMTKLNQIDICSMNLSVSDGRQNISMTLQGNLTEKNMRILLCQIAKESLDFAITELQ